MRKVYTSPAGEKQYNRPECIVTKATKRKPSVYIYSPSDSQLQAAGWTITEEIVPIPEPTQEEKARQEKQNRIYELKWMLSESDYKAIKFAEGELSADEYEPTRLERRAWRDEINAIEAELTKEGE